MSEYSPTRKGDGPKIPEEYQEHGSQPLIGTQSPGVARIEALSKHITTGNRIAIFIGVFFIAYAYGLVSQSTIRILEVHMLTHETRTAHYAMHINLQQLPALATTRYSLQSTLSRLSSLPPPR
jgi:hypothetical protein